MVAFCPLDEEEAAPPVVRRPPVVRPQPKPEQQRVSVGREESECNFAVLFFIVASIALMLTDQVK
ncbi:hypothetical protein DSLPV1_055 [Dishui lake phycodnavirus 1]|uniref:hypothetical protein n=1 Tax=Dishui lake phycodnavirus 1 TaxID=2079134 RepID=UPI000CD6B09A|nr:hypothetical protein C5Y57_gp055 [Dishui lake phycodnavirus 1]AUT19026.1 hypothetical protein DSLPV1_055 [Dishui lake phycodnavirus 1]